MIFIMCRQTVSYSVLHVECDSFKEVPVDVKLHDCGNLYCFIAQQI